MKTNDDRSPSSELKLTRSQEQAYADLKFFYEMHRRGIHRVGGISTRPCPLVIAPSGGGKTFLINRLADENGLPLFSLNVQNWIVRGAKNDGQITLAQISEFVRSNQRGGIIFIDEVNKLSSQHAESSSWTADVFSEVLAFLDGDRRLDAMGFDGGARAHLRANFFVVGAAAFQNEWRMKQGAEPIGFRSEEVAESPSAIARYEHAVRTQSVVPDELVFRFNDRLVIIEPPTAEEFAAQIQDIRARLCLPVLTKEQSDATVQIAMESGKMMRWLEGYASICLREVSDGLTRGSALPENAAVVTPAPVSKSPASSTRPMGKGIEPTVEDRMTEAVRVFTGSLEEISTAAAALEFALPELWAVARSLKDSGKTDGPFECFVAATRNLREKTGQEKASLMGYAGWLSERAFDVRSAKTDEARAQAANQLTDVAEILRKSLQFLRGGLGASATYAAFAPAIAGFMAKARKLEGSWNVILSLRHAG